MTIGDSSEEDVRPAKKAKKPSKRRDSDDDAEEPSDDEVSAIRCLILTERSLAGVTA